MFRTRPFALLCLCATAMAQTQPAAAPAVKLAFAIPKLFGPDGLTLPNPNHLAHFDSDFQANFGPFNGAIGSQLTSLPLPSPASGFTYTFDPALGIYTRSAQSYGPVLAERAETIGKEKFFAGFSSSTSASAPSMVSTCGISRVYFNTRRARRTLTSRKILLRPIRSWTPRSTSPPRSSLMD